MNEFNEQDPLESFLRKSLRDFSDSPPDDTWDGIHQQLPQAVSKPNFFYQNKWQILATLFFISVIGYQSYFFKKEINSLTEKIEMMSVTSQTETRPSKNNSNNSDNNKHTNNTSSTFKKDNDSDLTSKDFQKNTQYISEHKSFKNSESNSSQKNKSTNSLSNLSEKTNKTDQSFNSGKQSKTTGSSNLNANTPNQSIQQLIPDKSIQLNSKNSSSSLWKSTLNNDVINPTTLTLPATAEDRVTSAFLQKGSPSKLEYSNLTLKSTSSIFPTRKIETPELDLNQPKSKFLETQIPDIPNGKWSIGLYGNTLRNWASITSVKELDNGNGNGNNDDDDDIRLNAPLVIGQCYSGGIQIQRHLSRKWSLLFGLEYQGSHYRNSFETNIKFEDRSGGSSGSSDPVEPPVPVETEFNFSYQLNTALGSTEISFDTERDMESPIEIDDDATINNKVSIHHRIQTLSVPVFVQRNWKGRKPIYLSAKGGLILNWMKDYKLTLESFEVNSDLLLLKNTPRVERNIENESGQQNNLSLNYSVGIGVHYDFNSRVGVSLEPRLTGSILPWFRDGIVHGNQLGLGIGGLVYYNF